MNIEKEITEKDSGFSLQKSQEISQNIRDRRSIYANEFIRKELPDELLDEILINATWAPTHKMTEPWRFVVFKGKYLKAYGEYMAAYYKDFYAQKLPPEAAAEKCDYLLEYPLNAACMIGIVLARNEKIGLPEWEELAAVSAAVQNMALTCTAYNIGSYWSTARAAIDYVTDSGLAENEKSLGLLYVGYYPDELEPSGKKRSPLSKKVTYFQ